MRSDAMSDSPGPNGYRYFTPLGCVTILALLIPLGLLGLKYTVHTVYDRAWADSIPKQVRAVLDAQVEDWNRGDLDGFMTGYWKSDELRFYSGGTVTSGWQATLDRYTKRYKSEGKEMGALTFSDVQVEALGREAALARGRWKVVTSKESFEGLFTLVVRHTPDGWKIVHDHTSMADKP